MRITAAIVARNAGGTPFSPLYNDVYHSAEGGIAQCRHVFLDGNGLPARWRNRRIFTILETGFGLGLNFLTTWQAWRDDPARCGRLHFVSLEKHPLSRADLRALHAACAGLPPCATQLQAAWPELVPGMHRLHFESGRVTLTLAFAEAATALPQLQCRADAFFLDGFAPDRNSDMWTPAIMKHCARLAAADATLATYSTARPVRDALEAAGFSVQRQLGYGRKRHMLSAQLRMPAWSKPGQSVAAAVDTGRHAMVIGAGVAGAAVCERLASRGWKTILIDRLDTPAKGTSGLHAGAIHPHISRDDCVLSRLTRNGFLYSLAAWHALENAGHRFSWQLCGVAQPAEHRLAEQQMAATLRRQDYPADYAGYCDRDALSRQSGCELAYGGCWYPRGGWVQPASLVNAQLARARPIIRLGRAVDRLARENNRWRAFAADGSLIAEASVAVIANSDDATRLAPIGHALKRIRGQLTYLPGNMLPMPRSVVTGKGYLLPHINGRTIAGSTYDIRDDEPRPGPEGHHRNLAALAKLTPGIVLPDIAALDGAVGFRAVALDRLPLIGAIPDINAVRSRRNDLRGAHLADIPRLPGLYGAFGYASRGLTWAALGGELVASLIENEVPPLEKNLADAIDPARMLIRQLRQEQAF